MFAGHAGAIWSTNKLPVWGDLLFGLFLFVSSCTIVPAGLSSLPCDLYAHNMSREWMNGWTEGWTEGRTVGPSLSASIHMCFVNACFQYGSHLASATGGLPLLTISVPLDLPLTLRDLNHGFKGTGGLDSGEPYFRFYKYDTFTPPCYVRLMNNIFTTSILIFIQ